MGYVISGSAKLDLEGQTLNLKAGLVGAGGSDAPIHDYRAVHGRRGDRTTGRGSWSRYAGLSRNAGLHLRRLRPGICHDRLGPIESTWIFEARAMASNPNDQKKRSSAMRTVGEGVPPRSAVVPTMAPKKISAITTNAQANSACARKRETRVQSRIALEIETGWSGLRFGPHQAYKRQGAQEDRVPAGFAGSDL